MGGLAAAAMLGGCGGNGDQAAPEGSTQGTEAAGDGGGVVRWAELYSVESGVTARSNQEWLARVVEQFEEENPGWTVELEGFGWDEIDRRAILDVSAGVPHDLVFTSSQLMAQHVDAGSLLDLTPHLEGWDDDELDDFGWSPVWEAARLDGEQLGVPVGMHTRLHFFNRELLAEAGVDPDAQLTDLDAVVEIARQVTDPAQDRWGLGVFMGPSRATIELSYAPLVWHFGGDFFDLDGGRATLTSDASVRAVQWLYDAVHTHEIAPPYSYAGDASHDQLILNNALEGRALQAMGYGSYWIGALQDAGMVENCFPASPDCSVGSGGVMATPGDARAGFTNAWCLSVHALSEQPEMAMRLMEVALRQENLADFPDAGLPARASQWEEPEYQSDFYQEWLAAAESGRSVPATPHYPELADSVSAAIQEVLTGGGDVAETMQRFEEEWNSRYAE